MNEIEIRAKAAELSMIFSAHVTAAIVMNDGVNNLTEMSPLILAPEIEKYIIMGTLPEPIPVTKRERK